MKFFYQKCIFEQGSPIKFWTSSRSELRIGTGSALTELYAVQVLLFLLLLLPKCAHFNNKFRRFYKRNFPSHAPNGEGLRLLLSDLTPPLLRKLWHRFRILSLPWRRCKKFLIRSCIHSYSFSVSRTKNDRRDRWKGVSGCWAPYMKSAVDSTETRLRSLFQKTSEGFFIPCPFTMSALL